MSSGPVANNQNRFIVTEGDAPTDPVASDQFSKVLLSFILPFMAVHYASPESRTPMIINIVLCLFLYLPGIMHALYVVLKAPEEKEPTND